MKKYIYGALAIAAITMASCSQEEPVAPPAGEGNVTFSAKLPAIASRAFADGTTAANLDYYVYDAEAAEGTAPVITGTATFDADLTAQVNLSLVTGKTYDIVFWASSGADCYTYTEADRSITVTYGGEANDEARDAFFNTVQGLEVKGAINQSVVLNRPFAQVNVGTSDLDIASAAGFDLTTTGLKMVLPTTLNLMDGTVSGEEAVAVEFTQTAIPTAETFPVEPTTYDYISMNYVLTGADKSIVDLTLTTDHPNRPEIAFNSVPVQRNYRTNIFGALLTNPANFEVKIDKEFGGNQDVDQSGDEIAPGVRFNADTKTYILSSAEGMEWFANESKTNLFTGYTVKLSADIDLKEVAWTPVAKNSYFNGTFDGAGFTVANLTVSDPDAAGLFWSVRGTVKNLTLTNVNVSGNFKAGAVSGDGLCGHFENCTVDGGKVVSTPRLKGGVYDDGNNVGGITGYLSAEPSASLTGCTVRNLTVQAYRTVGAVVGTLNNSAAVFENNTAENCKVISFQNTQNYDGAPRRPEAGELFGRTVNSATPGAGNTATAVEVSELKADDGGNVAVSSAEAFRAVGAIVAAGNDFKGATLTLDADIDLEGQGMYIGSWANPFRGTFDGQGHTIANVSVNPEGVDYDQIGLFMPNRATIKNVVIDGATVRGRHNIGLIAGNCQYSKFENITVKGLVQITVSGNDCGVIAGKYAMNSSDITIDVEPGSFVKCTRVNNLNFIGGVFGYTEEPATFTNIKSNIDVIGVGAGVGGVTGMAHRGTKWINCSSSGNISVAVGTNPDNDELTIGGIAGMWMKNEGAHVVMQGCSFTGTLSSTLNGEPVELTDRYRYSGLDWNGAPNTDSCLEIID
ncbi:MAG: hypothetical protein NC418_09765 [Muribaculaceae bacterium]|nr:hypothetical protein [Muribaculaceae bacterium]